LQQDSAWQAKLALNFQIPSQSSLHRILKTHCPLAPRMALLRRRFAQRCKEVETLNHEAHEFTRKGQRRRAALGQAKLALLFQIPLLASLHGIVKSHRSLASRAALLGNGAAEDLGMRTDYVE
jgi:hypothetical protein